MPKKVAWDLDDSTIFFFNWDRILRLKDRYPNLKLSCFHIPFDFNAEKSLLRTMRDEGLKRLKENLDWIQLIPHGVAHLPQEFMNADRETVEVALKAINEFFTDDGLPYEKGFKAPQWLYNQSLVDVLDEQGWWMGVDRNQPNQPRTKKFYEYNYSIDEPFWKSDKEVWKLHGHMGAPSLNNIEDCFLNMQKIPLDAEWRFVTDFVESK